MRLLLVHRLREALDASIGKFEPRAGLRPMPPRGSETVDVCFVLDCTGSMGTWIDQYKRHVSSIIGSLRSDLAVGAVRVAFVAYRDFRDGAGRCVVTPFVPMAEVDVVTRAIGRERASGGGDGPEDVISAMVAVRELEWRGDMRACVFIADAPAHGYSPTHTNWGDDFPTGLCPDQRMTLPQVMQQVAEEQGVDLLCTKLGGYTDRMYASRLYLRGRGLTMISARLTYDGGHLFYK
jgi:hypothetical protein